MEIETITEWDAMIQNSKKQDILLYVYAHWCIPCHKFKPQFLEWAEFQFEIKTYCIDVDKKELLEQLMEYDISKVPTILKLQNGKEIGRVEGPRMDQVEQMI